MIGSTDSFEYGAERTRIVSPSPLIPSIGKDTSEWGDGDYKGLYGREYTAHTPSEGQCVQDTKKIIGELMDTQMDKTKLNRSLCEKFNFYN